MPLAPRGAPAPGAPAPSPMAPQIASGGAPAHTALGTPGPNFGGLPGALPPLYTAPTFGMQLGQALADAPLYNAQQQAAIATAQEQATTAKQAQEDALLQRLLPALRANPSIISNPAFMAHINPILQARGLQVPTGANGQPDAQKLAAMLSQTPQLTPAEEDQMYNSISAKEKLLGTASYTPNMFLADVKSARQRLQAAGLSTAPIDEYLSPDGTQLSDSFVNNYVGQRATEDIQHLKDLGVHINDEDALRRAIEQNRKDEFGQTLKLKYAQLSVEQQKVRMQLSLQAQRLQIAQGNLSARWASVQNAQARFQQTQNAYDLNVFKTVMSQASGAMDKAHSELLNTQQKITNIINTPGYRTHPELMDQLQQLTSQASDLQTWLNTNQPQLQAMQYNAGMAAGQLYEGVTGKSATATPPGTAGTSVPGEPGYRFTGEKKTDSRGTVYVVIGPDGKKQGWVSPNAAGSGAGTP